MAMAIKAQGGTGREKDRQREGGKLLVGLNLETSTFLSQLNLFQ